jgi:hypothetical protein
VDDLEAVARCFFRDDQSFIKSREVRKLKASMKPVRDRISSFTNAIKHKQSRIRIYSHDLEQDKGSVCLHGFFIEAFHGGAIAPSPIFHSTERVIFVTSFIWSVFIYLFLMSDSLSDFLLTIDAVDAPISSNSGTSLLRPCVVALARLPLYSYDDAHPFESIRFIVKGGAAIRQELDSHIYGSILLPWSKSPFKSVGNASLGYEGDGVTKSFGLISPENLRLQHWQ